MPLRKSRFISFLIFTTLFSSLLVAYYFLKIRPSYALYNRLSDQELRDSELLLVKNAGKGEKGRYIMFKQLRGAGFNNQVQDILLYHHLALASSRTYTYQPFVWRPRGEQAHVPLSAFLPGVTKNSISSAVFQKVCPEEEVVHVILGNAGYEGLWDHALNTLRNEDRCVVVDDWIFNWMFLTTSALHPVWPSFTKYLADHFQWSQAILDIVYRVRTQLNLRSNPSARDGDAYIALHLRRGDFETHCAFLAENRVGFTTWATLPDFGTSVFSPPLNTSNSTSILMHCYPSLHRILSAVTSQARLHPNARTLYVLHDGAIDHLDVYLQYYKLREALMDDGWARRHHWPGGAMKRTLHSSDVDKVRTWGENDYAVAVDVELARRAEGFIGNGYSSLTTQIAALRIADGGRMEDITFV